MAENTRVAPLPLARAGALIRRRGWLPQVAVFGAILLIVAGVVTNHYFDDRFGADGTARTYMSALAQGDASTAWSLANVNRHVIQADYDLVSQVGLAAQLALAPARPKAAQVTGHRQNPFSTEVSLFNGRKTTTLTLVQDPAGKHFGIYPVWLVSVTPAHLQVATAPGLGPVSVDGLVLPASAKTVAVMPGLHRFQAASSARFDKASTDVEVVGTRDQPTVVQLKPQLSASGQAAAKAAVSDSFHACSGTTTSGGFDSCPSFRSYAPGASYELIGDPAADASFAVSNGQLVAQGHYQVVSATQSPAGVKHQLWAEPFRAELSPAGPGFVVRAFQQKPSDVPPLVRPASASDAGILTAVSAFMNTCAAATVLGPPDCPNYTYNVFGQVSNVHWQLQGDPSNGAQVAFDWGQGAFMISGQFSMTVTYDLHMPYADSTKNETVTGTYSATVLWLGGQARVVSISGKR